MPEIWRAPEQCSLALPLGLLCILACTIVLVRLGQVEPRLPHLCLSRHASWPGYSASAFWILCWAK